jgi:23S rRNA (cytosine1962-C5)-methyltransferase
VRGDRNISELRFKERGFDYALPLELGQKTGFYLDQRMLRGRIEQLSAGKDVLDTYCFVGSFALASARGDAKSVVAVDSSALALEVAAATAQSNQLAGKIQFQHEDAVSALTKAGKKGGYDLVICDPPKLSPSRSSKNKAGQNLRHVASAAASATRRGGLLVLCSCSASLGIDELTRALCLGARDVGMTARVFERWFQGPDHPVPAAFNEGLYLSTIIAGIDTMTEFSDVP